jgi:hypothetical protein
MDTDRTRDRTRNTQFLVDVKVTVIAELHSQTFAFRLMALSRRWRFRADGAFGLMALSGCWHFRADGTFGTDGVPPLSPFSDDKTVRAKSSSPRGVTSSPLGAHLGVPQARALALAAWNSSSVIAPEAFRSASLASSSAVLDDAAASCTYAWKAWSCC